MLSLSRISRYLRPPAQQFLYRYAAPVPGTLKQPTTVLYLVRTRFSSTTTQPKMFDKILIANRGEIACRVMKTARDMGVKTIAVYSTADRNSLHVKMADEAFLIGEPAATASYLRGDKILEVALSSGAQAIHPGYGFLSENAGFAEACEKKGVTFIGPPASAILSMGSKSESKAIMSSAGVPVVPGYHGDNQDPAFLQNEAEKIGYPVMIKAVMGGGGKGMRIVWRPEDFLSSLESCKREAQSSFNDNRVLIEKYLQRPRHIEIQVFADSHGDCVYLFERDCSIQRRHQKVIEEAPGPGMSSSLRKQMGESAVAAAKAVKYRGAGTVEFIMDATDETYYFMEMNTRLQVEHPVTEMITQLDLVEWQLKVAAGFPLPMSQQDVFLEGHAFEARIYAENPARDFLPGTGTLVHLRPPESSDNVRIDTGVEEGDEVSVYYDPLIAKLIVWDVDRDAALRRFRMALENYKVVGVQTNIPFVWNIANHPQFRKGKVDTNFIKEYYNELVIPDMPVPNQVLALATVYLNEVESSQQLENGFESNPWNLTPFYLNNSPTRNMKFQHNERELVVEVQRQSGRYIIKVGQATLSITGAEVDEFDVTAEVDGQRISGTVVPHARNLHVFFGSNVFVLELPPEDYEGEVVEQGSLLSPMPGKIIKVMIKAGDNVSKGQPLMILEAMKMEHTIVAPADGVVDSVNYAQGDLVEEKKVLVHVNEAK